jgi:hypothetical protein
MFAHECLVEPSVDASVRARRETLRKLSTAREWPRLEGCADARCARTGRIHQNLPVRCSRSLFRARLRADPVERYWLKGKRQLDFITSQGCNFRCAFAGSFRLRPWGFSDPASIGAVSMSCGSATASTISISRTKFYPAPPVQAAADHIIGRVEVSRATMRADQGVRLREMPGTLQNRIAGCSSEESPDEMLKRIRKDITTTGFHTASKCATIAGIFPFIVGFPDESDHSIARTLDVAKRLRAMSPDFTTPIFYFKPYPGSEIVKEAVARGYRLPDTLEAWATFDYVDGEPGPWVSREKFQLIERFKFFHELAWERSSSPRALLRGLARYRCRRGDYRWPVEMRLLRWSGRSCGCRSAGRHILLIIRRSRVEARVLIAVLSSTALEDRYATTMSTATSIVSSPTPPCAWWRTGTSMPPV